MAGDLASAKREKSMAEFVLIIAMILALMATFIYYFLPQGDNYERAAFTRLANNFADRTMQLHSLWLMEHRPKTIEVKWLNSDQQQESYRVTLNQFGWVDSNNANACADIWQLVMAAPLTLLTKPIVVVKIEHKGEQGKVCRYSLPTGQYFDYSTGNGKLSKINWN